MCAAPAGKFFWFLLFNLLTLTYFTFFGKPFQLLLLLQYGPAVTPHQSLFCWHVMAASL